MKGYRVEASDLIRKESLSSSLKDVEKAKASWDRNINNNNSDDDDNDDVNTPSKRTMSRISLRVNAT
nr:13992_t:CDS:2 [Entrophospora candida]